MADSANDVLKHLIKELMDAETKLVEFLDSEPPLDQVGESLVKLHEIKSGMSDIYAMYSARVMGILQNAKVEDMSVHGATIEVRGASDRKKWNHENLASEVSRRIMESSVDLDTGEVLLSPQEIAVKMLDFVQPSYWRVKELAKFGINADNYCEVGDYKTNIIVRKAK
jgi:hypothetical protein